MHANFGSIALYQPVTFINSSFQFDIGIYALFWQGMQLQMINVKSKS